MAGQEGLLGSREYTSVLKDGCQPGKSKEEGISDVENGMCKTGANSVWLGFSVHRERQEMGQEG